MSAEPGEETGAAPPSAYHRRHGSQAPQPSATASALEGLQFIDNTPTPAEAMYARVRRAWAPPPPLDNEAAER